MREKFFKNEITEKICQKFHDQWNFHCDRLGNVDLSGVSRVWQAWHMPWAPLWREGKNCLAKLKSVFTVPWTYILRPCIHKLQSCINAASSPNAFRWACCASTTEHYDKIAVLWHNTRADIATEQERSLAMSMRPRPSHVIRKHKLDLLLHFRQVDIIENLVEMSLSPWLWESDCYANNCCWGRTDLEITWTVAAHYEVIVLLRWPLVPDK